jgi:hypothetical protein
MVAVDAIILPMGKEKPGFLIYSKYLYGRSIPADNLSLKILIVGWAKVHHHI